MYRIPSEFLQPREQGLFGLSMQRWMVLLVVFMIVSSITDSFGLSVGAAFLVGCSMRFRWEDVPVFDLALWGVAFLWRSARGERIYFTDPQAQPVSQMPQIWVESEEGSLVFSDSGTGQERFNG